MIHDDARRLLESDALAHVATLDADGRPYVTLAWVGLDDDEVVFATLSDQRKLRNLRRDPRVTISIETAHTNEIGLREYLVVYGSARVTEGGAPELLQELAYTYLGRGVKFPPMPDPPPGYVTRVAIERLGGIGPWR
ncbi:MAG TPA: TIGR03618 family F420-dependent PPOX class oxidoreductase [Actinomycetota bacterium]|nr:TIGR03618 family F420-dependent PPOX class oxidoreductase [Actinomycetota bacterium]